MAEKVLDNWRKAKECDSSEPSGGTGNLRVCGIVGKGAAAFRRRCPVIAVALGFAVSCAGFSCAFPSSALADDVQVVKDAVVAFAGASADDATSASNGAGGGSVSGREAASSNAAADGEKAKASASGSSELEARQLYVSADGAEGAVGESAAEEGEGSTDENEGKEPAGEGATDGGGNDEGDDAVDAGEDADESGDGDLPDYSSMSLARLKREVEKKTTKRDETSALLDSLTRQSSIVRDRLDSATTRLAEQQALAEHSVRDRYKVQRQYPTLIDAVLCSQDWESFIAGIEYIESASAASVTSVTKLRKEAAYYEKEQIRVEREKAGAEKDLSRVTRELEAATIARDEAQRKADMVADSVLQPDGANWKAGKKKFIAEWGPRIDAYLKGSPMAGLGDTFAKAAWENHVDPRFSPAISFTESGKGAVCIRPHNAWGWGAAEPNPAGNAAEWATWEDAIKAHVRGLANGYGYTISKKGAKKYCPPNWQLWYSRTVEQMNSI